MPPTAASRLLPLAAAAALGGPGCAARQALDLSVVEATLTPRDLERASDAPHRAAGRLSREQVERDLRLLAAALDRAYAGRALVNDDQWGGALADLGKIAARSHDARSFCDAVGDALSQLRQPELYATDAAGRRCFRSTTGGLPSSADVGRNVAEGAARSYTIERRSAPDGADAATALVGVRRFDARDGPGWGGFAAALEQIAAARFVVVDLRGASGDDPARGFELSRALGGPAPGVRYVPPSRPDWAAALRARYLRERGGAAPHEGAPRAFTVRAPTPPPDAVTGHASGPAAPPGATAEHASAKDGPGSVVAGQPRRALTVLLDGRCEGACEMTAYALSLVPGVELVGASTASRWLLAEPGTALLPASGVRVVLPTARYAVDAPTGGRGGPAPRGAVFARISIASGYDAMTYALQQMGQRQRAWARLARFEGGPPACPGPPAAQRLEDLTPQAAGRLDGGLQSELLRGGGGDRGATAFVQLSLPLPAAREFLARCFGVGTLVDVHTQDGESLVAVSAPLSTFLRLAQHDAVVYIAKEQRHQFNSR